MPINSYIENIAKRYALGNATEHTFRGDLQHLIEELVPEVAATNEPKRIECGAPDYVITRKDIPVGYIEAKDVGVDLEGKNLKEQFDRYRDALDNLVFTDYLDFRFYVNGEATASIRIAEVRGRQIVALPERFGEFTSLIKEFCSRTPVTIKSSKKLAEMMAEKAKILAFIIKNALEEDIATGAVTDLTNQMKAFKDILIHDIDAKSFADIYAQTIAYGMFAARLHDRDLDTFSRQEAAEKIPKTNPFLRKLFQFIAAYDLDTRIDWIVDALADLFRATDIAAILKNFGKSTQTHDPIMHFYETFLAEYDPKLRKSRGVFYTPEPVVDFIVRAVDDILKTEFNLPEGLADTSKTKIKVDVQGKLQEREVHKVQILDPATGTGTFLATVIKHIYKQFTNQQGVWNQYVDEHLIPRLNGFELLMASYAMAHLKLDLLLSETGYKEDKDKRFQIYLTNALEEYHPDTGTLFASWLSTEANEANHIKRDTPVMVVIGNPPYAISSSNRGKWIQDLIAVYKANLDEKKLNLDDDYIKFIRYGQWIIEKNGSGVLAFISNNGYIDGVTHRVMRKSLLDTFNKIYVVNLHGDANKKEMSPDGSADQNVFDIMQGVSITIFVKNQGKGNSVFHKDIFGKRDDKYSFLLEATLQNVDWTMLDVEEPHFFFKPVDFSQRASYIESFGLKELFKVYNTGTKTDRDDLFINFDAKQLAENISTLLSPKKTIEFVQRFNVKDSGSFKITQKIKGKKFDANYIGRFLYRPFDWRYIYYDHNLVSRPGYDVMKHVFNRENVGLSVPKQSFEDAGGIVSRVIVGHKTYSAYNINSFFPLYLYPEISSQRTLEPERERVPNLNSEIVDKIAAAIGLTFVAEPTGAQASCLPTPLEASGGDAANAGRMPALQSFAPIDILDYIYAVLHSPSYREKYKEFLKIDFPRVPYPKNAATFWQLVTLGGELRQIHLLESPKVNQFITGFPVGGDNTVEKIAYVTGARGTLLATPDRASGAELSPTPSGGNAADASKDACAPVGDVYFNDTQYFEGVPETAWNFYIGGYQPAQKWLKDRKGRKLSYDDITHYQKIIVALTETDRLMKEIDKIDFID